MKWIDKQGCAPACDNDAIRPPDFFTEAFIGHIKGALRILALECSTACGSRYGNDNAGVKCDANMMNLH